MIRFGDTVAWKSVRSNYWWKAFVLSISILLFCGIPLYASTIFKVGLDEMIENAEFVFEGEVINVQAQETANCGSIHTFVTFQILDIVKGDYPEKIITLRFLGGKVGDLSLHVSDMKIPAMNEKGIYFVESLGQHQVNPFVGWSQGHILVKPDKGGLDRVFSRDQRPITSVESTRFSKEHGLQGRVFSRGVARGLVTGKAEDVSMALSATEFKRILRRRVDELK